MSSNHQSQVIHWIELANSHYNCTTSVVAIMPSDPLFELKNYYKP